MDFFKLIKEIKDGQIGKLYVFFGNEHFLIKESTQYIRRTLLHDEFKDINYMKLDGKKTRTNELTHNSKTAPLFSDRRLIVIDDFLDMFGPEKEEEEFLKFIRDIPDHLCLILISPKMDKRTRIYKTIAKYGSVVEFKIFKGNLLVKWVKNRFKTQGKKISTKEASFLANIFDKSLEELDSEINKVVTYVGDKEIIEHGDILNIVRSSLENNIFLLMDTIGQKNPFKALSILNDIIKDGEAPIWVLFMLIRQLRLIYRSSHLLKQGLSFGEIQKVLKVHPYALKKAINQGENFNTAKMSEILNLAYETDLKIKRGDVDAKIAMEMLIVTMYSTLWQ
ncbi:MAG TPA: DNA polymerase III subunit delta [Thermoanaerobacterales bacterium]|nr:DNA polymerase III subunit delta [Thermoanaerobacterales bacterium]